MSTSHISSGNLYAGLPSTPQDAEVTESSALPGAPVRCARIISTGQSTEWMTQDDTEWCMVTAGTAALRIQDEPADRALKPGDWVVIPAGVTHRVVSTSTTEPTVWLVLHWDVVQPSTSAPAVGGSTAE